MAPTKSFTTQQAAAQIAQPDEHWNGDMGDPARVEFGYVENGFKFSGEQIATASDVMQLWADLANITFVETTGPDLQFENYRNPDGGDAAHWSEDSDSQLDQDIFGRSGTVGFNRANGWGTTNLGIGEANRKTLIHEIGHALGLGHPGPYNAGSKDDPPITWENDAVYFEDTRQYSVMSYFSEKTLGADFNGVSARTPLLHDIAAIQSMYGANIHTRTDSTVYGFNSTAGATYLLSKDGEKAVFSIWDAGGWDTLDFSGNSGVMYEQEINLNANTFSSIGGLRYNISIAQGVTIEAALGGSGRDKIYGNEVGNYLAGNGGDDDIFGGAGIDTISGGSGKDRLFGGTENDTLSGDEGNDTLNGEAGADTMRGGSGDDVYVVDDHGDQVIDEPGNAGGLHDKIYTTLSWYHMSDPGKADWVEELQFTGEGSFVGRGNSLNNVIVGGAEGDQLYGNGGDDKLFGGEGRDTLYGGADDDRLDGEGGADRLIGGTGNDTYVVGKGDTVVEDAFGSYTGTGIGRRYLSSGIDTVETALARYTLGANVENLTFITNANPVNVGFGNAHDNIMRGSRYGNDELHGLAGNDTYYVDNSGDVVNETEYVAGGGTGIARVNSGYRDVGSESDTVITTLSSYDLSNIGSNGSVARAFFPETLYGIIENLTYAGVDRFTGIGNDANNVITGGALSDNLYGGRGHDTVVGGAGNDGIDLGEGDDKAFIDNGTAEGGDVVVGGGGFDSVYADDSTIAGGLRLNVFRAGTGYTPDVNRVAFTSAAIDVDFIWGNAGSDVIDASRLDQRIDIAGMNGADTIIGGAAGDNLYGGDDADTITGGAGGDGMDGGRGSDTFVMDNGTEIGGDVAVGGEGYDVVEADASVAATGLRLVLFPTGTPFTPEVNLVRLTSAAMEVESVHGGTGNDWVDARRLSGDEHVSFQGNGGNDTFILSKPNQTIFDGGDDIDTVTYSGLRSDYEFRHPLPSDGWIRSDAVLIVDRSTGLFDVVKDVEFVEFSDGTLSIADALALQSPGKILIGTEGSDTLTGEAGNDRLEGRGGIDYLTGGAGADELVGGADTDFLYVDAEDTLIDGGEGFDYVYLDSSKSYGASFKVAGTNVEYVGGTLADDVIDASGVTYGTVLFGNYGADVVTGGAGSDRLDGSVGNDTLTGGAANDTFYFNGLWGKDTVTDFTRGQDVLDMTGVDGLTGMSQLSITGTAQGASIAFGADSILLQGVSAASLTAADFRFSQTAVTSTAAPGQALIGTTGSDTLTGDTGNDRLEGRDGIDFLTGGAGADELVGGADTDFIYVDAEDTLIDGGEGFDYVYLDSSKSYGASFTVAGTNVEYVGGTLADDVIDASGVTYGTVLFGNYGADVVIGGAGSDRLDGSVGNDTLTGGAANDTFYFNGLWGKDTVTDFTRGQDVLDMTGVDGLASMSQLTITDTAQGASIAFGADSILLQGVVANSLTASDFHLLA